MDNYENNVGGTNYQEPNLNINNEIKYYLHEIAKWGKFLGILGFILIGFMVLVGLAFTAFLPSLFQNTAFSPAGSGMGIAMAIYFLLFALLYFFPSWYIYQFAVKTQIALRHQQEDELTRAFSRLKSFFKFWGILIIILLCFYALGLGAVGLSFFVGR